MWELTADGRELEFHLAGINNENFIMQDGQTGSWWQQASGQAILGPLKGTKLKRVPHDEVTFATWKLEHPATRVLKRDPTTAGKYAAANWEEEVAAYPVVTPRSPREPLKDRDLVVGVEISGASRAYLLSELTDRGPVNDRLGNSPILLMVFEGGRSVRVFERTVEGQALEFFAATGADSGRIIDTPTGSTWDLTGLAIAGPLSGRRLARLDPLLDYWFDWKTYHPDTDVYRAGR